MHALIVAIVCAAPPSVSNPIIVRVGEREKLWIVDRNGADDSLIHNGRPFLEHLIGVRGVAPLSERRALVLEPPNLLDAQDTNGDGRADLVNVIAAGLPQGTGVAITADHVIHVAGANVRFVWDGERAVSEPSIVTSATPIVANGGSGRLVVSDGALLRREDVRVWRGSAADALSWCTPIGMLPDAPAALAFDELRDVAFCITSDRRTIVMSQPVDSRWGWTRATPPREVARASEGEGDFNDIDLDEKGNLFVACGAPSLDRHDGKILRIASAELIAKSQREDSTPRQEAEIEAALASNDTASRCAAVRATTSVADDRARALLRRAMNDKAIEVRAQALAEIDHRLRLRPFSAESALTWSDLLASSPDRMTGDPRVARLVASALWTIGAAASRIEVSPLVAKAIVDFRLADADEARAVISALLRDSSADALLDRIVAALRLNDRRPGRLHLDEAPSEWDATRAAKLDEDTKRVVRRVVWPGRRDALMDPEPPLTIADIIDRGRRLYSNCLTCHGAAGMGQSGIYPPLANSPYVSGDPQRLVAIVLHGLEGSVEIGGRTFAGTMPPPPMRSDDDIAAVLTYLRQAFGNNAEPIGKDVVARVRAATASRAIPWTMAELEAALK